MISQEQFETVVRHSRKMKERAVDPDGSGMSCRYRTETGNRCFSGVLIPDEVYMQAMENTGACILGQKFPELVPLLGTSGIVYDWSLNKLQGIHDNHFREREEKLAEWAEQYGFKMPEKEVT